MRNATWQKWGWLILPLFVWTVLSAAIHMADHGAHEDDDCITCIFQANTPTIDTAPHTLPLRVTPLVTKLPRRPDHTIPAPISTLHLAPAHSPPA